MCVRKRFMCVQDFFSSMFSCRSSRRMPFLKKYKLSVKFSAPQGFVVFLCRYITVNSCMDEIR